MEEESKKPPAARGSRTVLVAVLVVIALIVAGYVGFVLGGSSRPTPTQSGGFGTWSAASSMNVARSFSGIAVLPSGKVLVAGGFAGAVANSTIASAEIYDPTAGTWTMTASLHVGRAAPTATVLPGGKVLMAGGLTSKGPTVTSEIYDPTTGTWTMSGNLSYPRLDFTASLLNTGKVLAIGGNFFGGELAAAELYDPSSGTWSLTSPQPINRTDAIAVTLSNGSVLVAGGSTGISSTAFSALYNPTSGAWEQTGSLRFPVEDAAGVLLQNGKVLLAGGYNTYQDTDAAIQYVYKAEIYDPTTSTWSMTADMSTPRGEIDTAAVVLTNGTVLIPGGNFQTETGQASAEIYVPSVGKWFSAGTMSEPRGSGQMAVLLATGKVLDFGGLKPHRNAPDVATKSADLYTPA